MSMFTSCFVRFSSRACEARAHVAQRLGYNGISSETSSAENAHLLNLKALPVTISAASVVSRSILPFLPRRLRSGLCRARGTSASARNLKVRKRIEFGDRAVIALLLNQLCDQSRPARLMARSESRPGVTVKIFVEPIAVAIARIMQRIP